MEPFDRAEARAYVDMLRQLENRLVDIGICARQTQRTKPPKPDQITKKP